MGLELATLAKLRIVGRGGIRQMSDVFEFEGGEIRVWVEQESIHIFACDKSYRDPVELTPKTARELGAKLKELADRIERHPDSGS
jgi:hypothetical protein